MRGAALAVLVALVACKQQGASGSDASPPASPCRLAIPDSSGRVPLFGNEADFDAWAEASGRGDTDEAESIGRRSGFLVESGTACTVVGGTFVTKRKVRVDAGPHRGRSGWVTTEWTGP